MMETPAISPGIGLGLLSNLLLWRAGHHWRWRGRGRIGRHSGPRPWVRATIPAPEHERDDDWHQEDAEDDDPDQHVDEELRENQCGGERAAEGIARIPWLCRPYRRIGRDRLQHDRHRVVGDLAAELVQVRLDVLDLPLHVGEALLDL